MVLRNYSYLIIIICFYIVVWGSFRSFMANVMDCDIVICEFELLSPYNVHVRINTPGKGMHSLITAAMV